MLLRALSIFRSRLIDTFQEPCRYQDLRPVGHDALNIPPGNSIRFHKWPFTQWLDDSYLDWYTAYNESKHDRHRNFSRATFEHLIDAVCGLVALLSAQFHQEDYSSNDKGISAGSAYSYGTDDGMESGIGNFFRAKFPSTWGQSERYEFDWWELSKEANPIDKVDYNRIMGN